MREEAARYQDDVGIEEQDSSEFEDMQLNLMMPLPDADKVMQVHNNRRFGVAGSRQ
jgi:hypothetical protein